MLKVVIVDDEKMICSLISQLLDWEELGAKIVGMAYTGTEALEMIQEQRPDIIISDIRMPGYDGLELIKRTKEAGIESEFVMISGFKQFEYAQNAMKYGVKYYLLKPIEEDKLTEIIKEIAENLYIIEKINYLQFCVSKKKMELQAKKLFAKFGVDIHPGKLARNMTRYESCLLRFMRAYVRRAKLIVIDDIFDDRSYDKSSQLIEIMNLFKQEGISILWMNSYPDVITENADKTVVICNGQTRRIFYKNEISRYRVLECLTGKSTLKSIKKEKIEDSQIVFRAENITNHYFQKMSFYCKKGEILGIYDMRNKFSREWYRLLLGKRIYDGEIYVGEKKVRLGEEYHLVRNKMGIVDGDTYQSLLFPELLLLENLGIVVYKKMARYGWFINSRVRKYLERKGNEISENDITMKDVKEVGRRDAMQIIYQRWGLINPEILFCFQPFLRLDAITRAEVEHILLKFSLNGMSIVISSANIEDILTICDRVLVIEDNQIQQEVERNHFLEVFQ